MAFFSTAVRYVGEFGGLVGKLGVSEALEEWIAEKLEEAAEQALEELAEEVGAGPLFEAFAKFEHGVHNLGSLSKLQKRWLNALRPKSPFPAPVNRAISYLNLTLQDPTLRAGPKASPGFNRAASRQQWLAEGWQHDWRSQPRNPAGGPFHWSGEWVAGRLPYPVITTKTGKPPPTRKTKQLRKKRRKARKAGRMLAKHLMSSWATWSG